MEHRESSVVQMSLNDECGDEEACRVAQHTWDMVAREAFGDVVGVVNVLLCGREAMQQMNAQYRSRDYATDVLSFQYYESTELSGNTDPDEVIGDMALCLDVIRENAVSRGVSFEEELSFMIIHGILHVCGYDHEISEEHAQQMQQQELRLLDLLIQSGR